MTIKRYTTRTCMSCGGTYRIAFVREVGQSEEEERPEDCPACGANDWMSLPTIPVEKILYEALQPPQPPTVPTAWAYQRVPHVGCDGCAAGDEVQATGYCSCECHRRVGL